MIPFFLPLLILLIIGSIAKKSKSINRLIAPLKGNWFFIWILLICVGIVFKNSFVGDAGAALTLIIPNIAYLLAFAPSFVFLSDKKITKNHKLNCLMAIVSTSIFWTLTVTPQNWESSALAFLFIWPALLGMAWATSGILSIKSKVKTTHFNKGLLVLLAMINALLIYKNYSPKLKKIKSIPKKFKPRRQLNKKLRLEVHNKHKIFKAITDILLTNPKAPINNQVIMKNPEVSKIYQMKGFEIKNKYGGNIYITRGSYNVSVLYTGIPKGDACHNTYRVASSRPRGFDQIFVNNIPIKRRRSKSNRFICNGHEKYYTVKFSGKIRTILGRTKRYE